MNYTKISTMFLCFSLFFIYGCKEDDDILSGTQWKLEAFVDENTGERIVPQHEGENILTLAFESDKKFISNSVVNSTVGKYEISKSAIHFKDGIITLVDGETWYGDKFNDALYKGYMFSLSDNYLKLFYDENVYLLMKKL